jgi:hypothetical protein
MTDVATHLTEALEALPQEERMMITDSPSLANAWLMEQSESMEQPISALQNAWERITAREGKAVETLVRLPPSNKSSALNEYERIAQEERWFQSEVLKPLAIAHLRRRRMESEGLTYQDVADWEPAEEYLEETKKWVETPNQFQPTRKPVRKGFPSRQEANRQGVLMTEVFRVVKTAQRDGVTKTQILHQIGKDTSRWRVSCSEVLSWMMANKKIVRDNRSLRGAKYYLPKYAEHLKETEFHRLVYESLRSGPVTRTAIVKETCYVNPKGHAKVLGALKLLEREGLVRPIGNKWEMC